MNKRRGVARTMSDLSGLLVCDGELRNLTLPRPPYPTRFPFSTPYTLSGTGLACDRSGAGGKCGAQERVQVRAGTPALHLLRRLCALLRP